MKRTFRRSTSTATNSDNRTRAACSRCRGEEAETRWEGTRRRGSGGHSSMRVLTTTSCETLYTLRRATTRWSAHRCRASHRFLGNSRTSTTAIFWANKETPAQSFWNLTARWRQKIRAAVASSCGIKVVVISNKPLMLRLMTKMRIIYRKRASQLRLCEAVRFRIEISNSNWSPMSPRDNCRELLSSRRL